MMTNSQLRRYLTDLNLSTKARAFISHIREPITPALSRSDERSTRGQFVSKKMRRVIPCEGRGTDLLWGLALESDPSVLEFYVEPPITTLSLGEPNDEKRKAATVPYYFVLWADVAGWADCLTDEDLAGFGTTYPGRYCCDAHGRWYCPIGECFARPFGLSYRVLTPSQILSAAMWEKHHARKRRSQAFPRVLGYGRTSNTPSTNLCLRRPLGPTDPPRSRKALAMDVVAADLKNGLTPCSSVMSAHRFCRPEEYIEVVGK